LRFYEWQYLAGIEGRADDTLEGDLDLSLTVSGSPDPNYAGSDPGDLADKRDLLFTSSTFNDEVTVI
jgi:hypothetical protein